jgi:hypothetical protein
MPLFFSLDFTVGLEQCWAVLDFYEEPLVPVLVQFLKKINSGSHFGSSSGSQS